LEARRYDLAMAKVQYESKDDGEHRFWTARYGRYAIRIDANRPGLYRWVITLEARSIRKGTAPGRDEAPMLDHLRHGPRADRVHRAPAGR
jgi:hypothetical protein